MLLCLAKYANSETGQCWPSNTQLGADTGFAPTTVSRAVGRLKKRGLIKVKRRRNNSSVFTFTNVVKGKLSG